MASTAPTLSPAATRLVEAFLGDQVPGQPVALDVHPDDDMLRFIRTYQGAEEDQAALEYFRTGLMAAQSFLQVARWRFGDDLRDVRWLDFASGYGRATRFLVHQLPPDRLWVSDILADAVRFQRERFGVGGFPSTPLPADLDRRERFHFISVASLFSHLPAATFGPWLERLLGFLEPAGLLVISVHDETVLPRETRLDDRGTAFHEFSEVHGLEGRQYGTAWVSESFLRRTLDSIAGGGFSLLRVPKGLWHLQDLYVIAPRPGLDFAGLDFDRGPEGFAEVVETTSGVFRASGWAADPSTGDPVTLELCVDGRRFGATTSCLPRPDVRDLYGRDEMLPSGWYLEHPLREGAIPENGLILVKARNRRGRELVLLLSAADRVTAKLEEQRRRFGG